MNTTLSVFRLPLILSKKIEKIAKETERSKSFIIRKAIEFYLNEYEDYQIALKRLNDKNDDIITAAEMRKRFGK